MTLYSCAVCAGHFPLEFVELLEDDEQACLPCARRECRAPREIDEIRAATPGGATLPRFTDRGVEYPA